MDQTRVIEVKKNILAANDEAADAFRAARAQEGTFFVDVMASPGAGKTTLLLALIRELRARGVEALGVIEADLESDVDALKIKEAGVASVELNTRGVCHVEMGMVTMAFEAFDGDRFDYLFLENIGNLVCPADFDTGAHTRVMLLSCARGLGQGHEVPAHVRRRGRAHRHEMRLPALERGLRHGSPERAGAPPEPRARHLRHERPHRRGHGRARRLDASPARREGAGLGARGLFNRHVENLDVAALAV